MKKAQAQRHDCCHEAGHAVAGVINGDKLVLVVAYADAPMSENQRARYETATRGKSKRGATLLKRGQPNCSCGGRVKCNAISMFGSARESVKTCILRGFLGGAYFRSAGRPNNTFSPK